MIALSIALVAVAALAHDAFRRHLAAERERLEASKPVAPHEALASEVEELKRRVGGIESWAKR